MNAAPIASVIARMQGIEARFAGMSGAARRSPVTTVSFDQTFGETQDKMLGLQTSTPTMAVTVAPQPSPGADTSAGAPTGGSVDSATPFAQDFEEAGRRYDVPARLLAAVGWVESRYQTDAVSPDGALGVMQLMPETAQALGVDPRDPHQAIDGAARLLAAHHARFGSWDLALAAYYSGPGAVARAGNEPTPRGAEYVRRVHDRLETS